MKPCSGGRAQREAAGACTYNLYLPLRPSPNILTGRRPHEIEREQIAGIVQAYEQAVLRVKYASNTRENVSVPVIAVEKITDPLQAE